MSDQKKIDEKIAGKAKRAPLKKIGTVQKIDANTGAVLETKQNAMTMLGPPPDKCQECAVDHPLDQPHNQQSLYYQMHFNATHGRWPTWSDAMAHCTPEVQQVWREQLINLMKKNDLPVPDDLMEPKQAGR